MNKQNQSEKLKRAVIKEELVAITGNHIGALILNQLLYWTDRVKDIDKYLKEEKERILQTTGKNLELEIQLLLTHGWIYKRAEELIEELMLDISPITMRRYLIGLEKLGFLSSRTNPIAKWDKTLQYRAKLNRIIVALEGKGYSLEGYKHLKISDVESDPSNLQNEGSNLHFEGSYKVTETTETTSYTFPSPLPSSQKQQPKGDNRRSSKGKKENGKVDKILFERLRSGIYRNDLFAMYDNLIRIRSIEQLAGDAAYKAIKSVLLNNEEFLRQEYGTNYSKFPKDEMSEVAARRFPYDRLPDSSDEDSRRNFFVSAVCNTVAEAMVERLEADRGKMKR